MVLLWKETHIFGLLGSITHTKYYKKTSNIFQELAHHIKADSKLQAHLTRMDPTRL